LLGIFHIFPAQAQQSELTDQGAQGSAPQGHQAKHHQYQLVQMPTFGGPGTNFFDNTNNIAVLNARGVVSGGAADTLITDPYSPAYWWIERHHQACLPVTSAEADGTKSGSISS
jgi:hypothetical protein